MKKENKTVAWSAPYSLPHLKVQYSLNWFFTIIHENWIGAF